MSHSGTDVALPVEYGPGPVTSAAVFATEIGLPPPMSVDQLIAGNQSGLRVLSTRPGMVLKYLPYRPAGADERPSTGGRYLFGTVAQARDFRDHLETLVLPGEDTLFWERPFFTDPRRSVWHVVGGHHFTGVEEHHVIRFEQRRLDRVDGLTRAWERVRDRAAERGLAGAQLLVDERERTVALFTAARRPDLDARAATPPTLPEADGLLAGERLGDTVLLDRTSVTAMLWSPLLRARGGPAGLYPIADLAVPA